jgi:hypothetical protein
METRIKILISILITVVVGYFFFKEMKSDYNKDLENFKDDMDNN